MRDLIYLSNHSLSKKSSYFLSLFFQETEVGGINNRGCLTLSSNWQEICLYLCIDSQFASFSKFTANLPLFQMFYEVSITVFRCSSHLRSKPTYFLPTPLVFQNFYWKPIGFLGLWLNNLKNTNFVGCLYFLRFYSFALL